jgi:polynucleotide 5'-hydroxyl-kinase GRC3/NOL9
LKIKAKANDFYILKGPGTVRVKKGRIEVAGKTVEKDEKAFIPLGKSYPFEVQKESHLSIEVKTPGELKKVDSRTIPSNWGILIDRIMKRKVRTVLILGQMDTGKSFFAAYIANKLLKKGLCPAVLDGDPGQSDVGIPGTLGLVVLKKQVVFLNETKPSAISLVGSHSPGLHLMPTIVGIKRLAEIGLRKADIVIVNTTGWVQGDGGRLLKRAKMEILSPDVAVLLQRGAELEHLVKGFDPEKVVRFHVSKKASYTSPEERKNLREEVTQKYFKQAKIVRLPFRKIATDRCYFKTGTEIKVPGTLYAERLSGYEGTLVVTQKARLPESVKKLANKLGNIRNVVAGDEVGMLVGLLDRKGDTLGLGRIEKIDYKKKEIFLLTPVGDKEKIKVVQFGSLKITPQGREIGFISPGYF